MAWLGNQTYPQEIPPPCTLVEIRKQKSRQIEIVLSVEGKTHSFLVDLLSNVGISLPGGLEDIIAASLPRSKHFGAILERVVQDRSVEFPILLSDPDITDD